MRIHILILGYNGLIPSSRPKIDTVFRVQSQKFSLAFDKLNEIEKDRCSLNSQSDVFGLLSSRNFATMATRLKYFSLLT